MISIVVPVEKYLVFYELGKSLSYALINFQIQNEIIVDFVGNYKFNDDNIYILYGAECFENNLPKRFIVYQFEQMWAKVETVNSIIIDNFINNVINKSIAMWDYSEPNINFFKKKNVIVPIIHVSLGYTTAIDYCSSHPNIIKDIPSVFIGNVCLRRINIIDKIISKDVKPFISVFNNNLWNNEHSIVGDKTNMKKEVLCRTKIGLDISIYNPVVSGFNLLRVLTFMANKCLVICEHSMDFDLNLLFKPYVVMCEIHEFNDKIKYYLNNEIERESLVNKAYNWLISEFRYERFVPVESLLKYE